MPARSEAEEITPTGVRFQDEYSFFLRNTPRLSCGRRLLTFYITMLENFVGLIVSHTFFITCLLLIFGFSPSGIANTLAAHFAISWILSMFLGSVSTVIFLALGRIVYAYRTGNSLVWYFEDHTPFFASVLSCGRIRMFISPPRNDPM